MIWRIGQFPELNCLEPGQRRQLLRQVPLWIYPALVGRALLRGLIIAVLCVGGSGVIAAGFGGSSFVVEQLFFLLFLLVLAFIAARSYGIELRRLRRTVQLQIIHSFSGQRLPMCLRCGYDLRGLTTPACPECGWQVG